MVVPSTVVFRWMASAHPAFSKGLLSQAVPRDGAAAWSSMVDGMGLVSPTGKGIGIYLSSFPNRTSVSAGRPREHSVVKVIRSCTT